MFDIIAITTEEEFYKRLERKYTKLKRVENRIFEKLAFLERRIGGLIKLDEEIRRYNMDVGR